MKVLVTGGSGFIGQNCLPKLYSKGFEVHAVSSSPQPISPIAKWHTANLLDVDRVRVLIRTVKPSHLLHLAWCTQHHKYWASLENLNWVQSSLTLFEEFTKAGGQRIVAAGTCAEYDWGYGLCVEEKTPLLPTTMYGTYKNALQIMLRAWSKETGLSSAWGRIFSLYGPGEKPDRLVASVIKKILCGQFASCENSDIVRDYLHVDDVASAFVTLLESKIDGPVNIGSGVGVSLGEITQIIAKQIGRSNLVSLNVSEISLEPKLLMANIGILESTPWKKRFDLKNGLDDTINWWRTQLETSKKI